MWFIELHFFYQIFFFNFLSFKAAVWRTCQRQLQRIFKGPACGTWHVKCKQKQACFQFFFQILCLWHVNRNEVTKWRNDEMTKYYVICAAVSALSWLSQFCTSKNRFRENSKIRNFVTYQITFLLTCQPHLC